MLSSPFAYFRGTAAVMNADLRRMPNSGLIAQLCGDAHAANFGGFAAPDRHLVFDVNDFDETFVGPCEWDMMRLGASLAVLGRDSAFHEDDRAAAVLAAAHSYRDAMGRFAQMRTVDVWYARLDLESQYAELSAMLRKSARKRLDKAMARGRHKDSLRALSKLTGVVDGVPQIVSDPPLVVPISELHAGDGPRLSRNELLALLEQYRRTLPVDTRRLLAEYRPVDLAHKVVGIGSVGVESWIVLLLGNGADDPLFLQIKEAQGSGRRVVEGQRLIQAGSDIFLGWVRLARGRAGRPHHYYVRQLWDQKITVPLDQLAADELAVYARMCGWTLARAHARTGDRVRIAAYLGESHDFDQALVAFAEEYADQNERDYAAFAAAVEAGSLEVCDDRSPEPARRSSHNNRYPKGSKQ